MVEDSKPDFWKYYMDSLEEWELKNGSITCNEDHEKAILFALEKVWLLTKKGEI